MSGTILFRPVEANITHDTNWLGKMDPYCKFSIGANHVKSAVCRHGGTRPHWGDTVSLPISGLTVGAVNAVRLELFDKDKFRPDDHIAYADIDLAEIQQMGSVSKWYPLYHRKKPAGEILIEAAVQQQQQQQQMLVQNVVPTTYVQETIISSGQVGQVVGESYVVGETITTQGMQFQGGMPLNQGVIGSTNIGSYTTMDPNLGMYGNNAGLAGANSGLTGVNPGLASKVSALGPSGGIPHGYPTLKGQVNAGYSERPGYTLGDTEANPTCQTNLDSNGGGFFNKPGREKRAEPYMLSNPGTYGIPHGMTIDTAGHLRPDVTLERQAPIGTINHPGITGYVDSFTKPQGQMQGQQQGLQQGLQQGSYGTGLSTGIGQAGSYTTGLSQQGLQGSYGTGLGTGIGQAGSYTTGLTQPGLQGSYTSELGQQGLGLQQGLGQQGLGLQQGLGQQGLGLQQGLGQQGLGLQQGLGQQGLGLQQGANLGQQGLGLQQGANLGQQGLGQGSLNAGLGGQTYGQGGQF